MARLYGEDGLQFTKHTAVSVHALRTTRRYGVLIAGPDSDDNWIEVGRGPRAYRCEATAPGAWLGTGMRGHGMATFETGVLTVDAPHRAHDGQRRRHLRDVRGAQHPAVGESRSMVISESLRTTA